VKTVNVNGSQRGTLEVSDNHATWQIYIPKGASPANVSTVLLAVTKHINRQGYRAGETVCDIIAAISPRSRVVLIGGGQFDTHDSLLISDLHYGFRHTNRSSGFTMEVRSVVNGNLSEPIFVGQLHEFTDWAAKTTGLEGLVKKVVQFKYNGGSAPGAVRTVRVERVGLDGDNKLHVEGLDLNVSDLKDAYRKYAADRIEGDITVVNG
jgi:hypothetical protein